MGALDNSLDSLLHQIGDFGKYQIFTVFLVCFGIILHSALHVAYAFTAKNVEYRCEIPECDIVESQFEPPWLINAVPYKDQVPDKCAKFVYHNTTDNSGNCSLATDFLAKTEKCSSFIYKTKEYSILREFDLQCDDNLWKLTLVGTIGSVGQFVVSFIFGTISDKYGRRIVFIMGMTLCGIFGLLKSFSPSYIWFLVFEFIGAGFSSGGYICGYIIGVELVSPKKRVVVGTLINLSYTVGEVFAAGTAWIFQDWKIILYVLYSPPLLLLSYFWLLPESVRWNLSRGKSEEAIKTLKRAAEINGKEIPSDVLEKLSFVQEVNNSKTNYIEFFKSTPLVLRLINCCFCWITSAFLFYGLSLNSVSLDENSYLDFILSSLVEIPAYFACLYIVDNWGRRWSLSITLFLTGVSCLIFIFIPKSLQLGSLIVYLVGKFGATAAYTVVYVITSEIFPTPYRHSMMGICSTFGKIGSMVAPQTPLLAQIWEPLPIILYSVMAIVAGFLTMLFPETLNTKLPDTIEEAVTIGKQDKVIA